MKESNRMWYIFPQIIDLESTQMSKIYGIKNIEEAIEKHIIKQIVE